MTAIHILKTIPRANFQEYVFVNSKTDAPLSSHALLQKLIQIGGEYTVHGFRSTFRDWVSEETAHTREVAEATLAHSLKDKVEAAYRRGDFFQKRRSLMQEWSQFCYMQNKKIKSIGA